MISKSVFALFASAISVVLVCDANAAAVVSRKQSAIQTGTTVRARTEATGIYDQNCHDAYYGCMDQFCIIDNSNGGSCMCSDLNEELEKQFAAIQDTLIEAERIRTEEVERVKAGAQADIIFNGSRRYDKDGNVIYDFSGEKTKEQQRESLLSLWDNASFDFDEVVFENDVENIADKTGNDLFVAADELCRKQMPASCNKDINFLHQLYARQITSDCKAFENSISQNKARADAELAGANADVRTALKESFAEANKYDLGQCMVEFRKCMQTEDACGSGWINCVSTIASENMQNNSAKKRVKSRVSTVDVYEITPSTMEMLNAKRNICENVLNQCVAVRNDVWPAFLREVAPTLKAAELNAESQFRQSCLTDISNCIQTACRDDIAGKGVATMDSCLSRPDMARSFCKVELEPCERMEPLIWGYVKDKLAAMRVDACTKEVKDCFTDETRCGADFSNCIGMDYSYIHDICPLDKLVVCKANRSDFSMADIDSMLMGLYLNVDNAALNTCQNLVNSKMMEICGSTTDCNKFASDDTMGTGSLRSVKDGDKYRVTGMISFGSLNIGDSSGMTKDGGKKLDVGKIGVQDYLAKVREYNSAVPNADEIIFSIEEELNNVAGNINRTIWMIEQDPEIQYCVSGRNLEQITGVAGARTTARFPHLLDQVKIQIALSALRKAQDNYNEKFNAYVADATKNASADLAQYMCQMMPVSGGAPIDSNVSADVSLAPPYAISYEVGSGLDANVLARGGRGSAETGGTARMTTEQTNTKFSQAVASVLTLGLSTLNNGGRVTQELPSGTRELWASFNRETRVCHFCTSTVTKSCKNTGSRGFLGLWDSRGVECTESEPVEKCEDIQM
ncbi:MAG: hypothetical protein J6W40_00540 [Alphaproteobacteria bacterium]|nr:hypothetical protein [Alphaproteobacteria bacterium]